MFHLVLMDAYHKGVMNMEQLIEINNSLRFIDEGKRQWSIGVSTGQWYLWSDYHWIKGYPQSKLTPLILDNKA